MIVIENISTGKRFNYPSVPVNKETPEGFSVHYAIPKGYKLSEDQTAVEQTYVHEVDKEVGLYVETTNYPAT